MLIRCLFILLWSTTVFAQSPDEIKVDVTTLCKLSRVTGTDGCKQASAYLQDQLQKNGYVVELQEFSYKRQESANVLATKTAPLDTVIVVGAHYDAVRGAPGADDNASGTASVLAVAKMLKTKPTRHIVSFQLYAGEEQGLIGSAFYCKYPKWPIDKHIFMLNLDMVGYLKTGTYTLAAYKPPIDDILRSLFAKYAFAEKITLRTGDDSDHASFTAVGIPAIFLHTGLHNNYHKPSDTPDKLNYTGMANICKYAEELVLAIDKSDTPNYFLERQ